MYKGRQRKGNLCRLKRNDIEISYGSFLYAGTNGISPFL